MILSGVITLGRDTELKYTQSGTAVASLNGAYNAGFGENKVTQWVSISLFGKQAESLCEYLLKGVKIDVTARDVVIEQWTKNDGTVATTLKGVSINVNLVSKKQNISQATQQNQQQQQQGNFGNNGQPLNPQQVQQQRSGQQAQQNQPPPLAPNNFDDDDVPF